MGKIHEKYARLKLKWKVFLYLLSFCLLLLTVLWNFQTVLLSPMYQVIRKQEFQEAIQLVEAHINKPDLEEIINYLQEYREILVEPAKEFPPEKNMTREDKGRPKGDILIEEKTFILENGSEITLLFRGIITPVQATVRTLEVQLHIITGFILILSIALAFFIAKKIAKPIEDLNTSAKKLAEGNYNTTFSGKGFLEIQELSNTLNTTATELGKTENLRKELIANISHDLRTPLALIYSYAEMMQDFPKEITQQQTQIIMEETQRLAQLVNDVLDVSRLETGIIELNYSTYSLTASLKDTIERVAELVKKEAFQLTFEYEKEIFVYADEIKITQAFYNLLLNAITHGGEDKKVHIKQSLSENKVLIEISDSGQGIAPEDLPYIWDRYYKVDKTHKRPITGTGLGLSIVKKIFHLHQDSYGVSSEQGKGSTFWFTLKSTSSPDSTK